MRKQAPTNRRRTPALRKSTTLGLPIEELVQRLGRQEDVEAMELISSTGKDNLTPARDLDLQAVRKKDLGRAPPSPADQHRRQSDAVGGFIRFSFRHLLNFFGSSVSLALGTVKVGTISSDPRQR
jgi:hypothetical protein